MLPADAQILGGLGLRALAVVAEHEDQLLLPGQRGHGERRMALDAGGRVGGALRPAIIPLALILQAARHAPLLCGVGPSRRVLLYRLEPMPLGAVR